MTRLINRYPNAIQKSMLAAVPFLLAWLVYACLYYSEATHLPGLSALTTQLTSLLHGGAHSPLWQDSWTSLLRLLTATLISAVLALCIGIFSGALAYAHALLSHFVAAMAAIPAIFILPFLWHLLGSGESTLLLLMVLGLAPAYALVVQGFVRKLPVEQIVRAQTQHAGSWLIMLRIIWPQALPFLLDNIRSLQAMAWLLLVAAEVLLAESGLGVRVFQADATLATVMIYGIWASIWVWLVNTALWLATRWLFPWHGKETV